MVKGPGNVQTFENAASSKMLSSPTRQSENTMDSFQDGGQMNSEQSEFNNHAMEGAYMHSEMNNYGPNPGEQGMGGDSYGRVNDGLHHMSQYNSYNRASYPNMVDNSMAGSGEFPNPNASFGQYQSGGRTGIIQQPGMMPVRPGMGMVPSGYNPNQQRMMSGQNISQQAGPTPTLNQLLQTPHSNPRYPQNSFDGYSGGPQKPGGDMASGNSPYGPPQSWMQNQRGYSQMSMSGAGPYRGQAPFSQQQNQNQMSYSPQTVPPNSQYSNQQGSLQQQPQPSGQPPGSSHPPAQRPTPQPSPHLSPAPSPINRVTPNPSPGPQRSTGQLSPGQRPSPSPSQRSSASISSPQPPGSSPQQQHNHQSSPKENSTDEAKLDVNSSLRPEPSPGSVSSRSTTPASVSGSSPMPPRPPSQQTDGQNSSHMSQSGMPAPGYNQQMMPPPMGPNQMGYSPGQKMPGMGSGQFSHFNSQYSQQPGGNNYPARPSGGSGMGSYPQNVYNGPGPMQGPGGNMYNNMGGPGMNRANYNMYSGQNMINNQYGSYGGPGQMGPGQTSQGGPGQTVGSPGPVNGPSSMNSMPSGGSGTNGPMPVGQGQTPIKGAQAAAQAAMAAANAAARSQPSPVRPPMNLSPTPRMYSPQTMGQSNVPPQSMSPLSQMGHMNQMGYNSTMNNMPNHPQNSVSPVPNAMGQPSGVGMQGKMNSYPNSGEQLLPRSKSSKSKSVTNSVQPPSSMGDRTSNNLMPGHGNVSSPSVQESTQNSQMSNIPTTQKLSSTSATPDMSDTSTLSNDSTSLGPVSDRQVSDNVEPPAESEQQDPSGQQGGLAQKEEQQPITTTANTTTVETTTNVTQSITSPVTSISTEPGNSNDSQPLPMDTTMTPVPMMNNFGGPGPQGPPIPMEEPVEKKRKTTDVGSVLTQPFARVAPSPGGASVASSGQSEDVENIGSPSWSGTPKAIADYVKLYEMGMEPGRRPFLDRLFSFLDEKGTPINTMPVISKQPLDLYRLYVIVQEKGGMLEVTKAKKWKEICGLINISGSASAAFTLKKNYIKYMFAFECRYERNGMDPAPVLAQMEAQLQQKRDAKHRRAPSPAGSQGSQDGFRTPNDHGQDYGPHMGGQYMNNNPNMGHMGPGMMGMMNNMGPHGGMNPNSMGGSGMPHHMGMQSGPGGHMMGNMPPQGMMPGNAGYMMQGGQGNMMGQGGMGQGGMMGPGMQGQNSMMGNMPPHSGSMMPNNMAPNNMMGGVPPTSGMSNSNMPPSTMMPPSSMMGSMNQANSMMPGGNNMSQSNAMMRGNMSQVVGSNQGMGPNQTGPSNSMPGMMKNSDSISCQDPFADEPPSLSKTNSGSHMPPFSGVGTAGQQNMPNSASPVPSQPGVMPSQNSNAGPASSLAAEPPNAMSPNSSIPSSVMSQSSASGMTTTTASSSAITSSSTAEATPSPGMPPVSGMPPQSMPGIPPQNMASGMPAQNMSGMMPAQNMSGMQPQTVTSIPQPNTSSVGPQNSSMPQSQNMPPQSSSFPPQNQNSAGGMPMSSANMSSQGQGYRDSPDMNRIASGGEAAPRGPADTSSSTAVDGQSGDMGRGNQQQVPATGNRQFPFGDQFSKPDRFDQSSPNLSQQSGPTPMPYSQHSQMSQPGTDQGPPGQHGSHGPPGYMAPGQGRYPNQMPSQPVDQYGQQGYPGNQPGYGPKPMMNQDQYQGYQPPGPGYGPKPSMPMGSGIYNTPNKTFPPSRTDSYMSPAFNPHFDDRMGPMHFTPTRPFPEYGVDNNQFDRRDTSQWSPMQQRYQSVPPYGTTPGMSPSGTPSMSRQRMSPPVSRSFTMSPVSRQKMGASMHGQYYAGKKEMHFPPDTVEATQPLLNKRRRLTKNDIGQIEAWRIMMALKSGMLAESTWALDTLNVLLFDDTTVAYFGLSHLPGLVEVLLDHFRRNLIDMFNLFEETEIGCGQDDLKDELNKFTEDMENLKDSETLEKEIETSHDTDVADVKMETNSNETEAVVDKTEQSNDKVEEEKMNCDETDEEDENEGKSGEEYFESRKNYSLVTRQGKEVKFDEEVDSNEVMDKKLWDVYCGFGSECNWWDSGKGDMTAHIKTHFEDLKEHDKFRKKFFRKPMKLKDASELKSEMENENIDSDTKEGDPEIKEGSVKLEQDNSSELSNIDNGHSTIGDSPDNQENSRLETNSAEVDQKSDDDKDTKDIEKLSNCEKDHTCNGMITNIKTEPRDDELETSDSTDSVTDKIKEEKNLFSDEPRMKLAVKYELLNEEELVQTCKNAFGVNTEGERCGVEDEAYQRNEPPLCLITEARNEIGKRCICISNIFRSLSCIPGNDREMSKHAGLVYIFGKLLLLHHKHLPRSRTRRKFDREDIDDDMVDITQGVEEWWWDFLNVLRENTFVIFANICAQLKLDIFPDEACLPLLEGLLHWVVCPSSCATDPLPTVAPTSVLSPLRLVLEAMCKLFIQQRNVDMLLATPPYERIVQLFSVLTKLLANRSEQVTLEFAVVLLSELVQGGSSAARGIALQYPSISLLIDFIETAEQKAVQVVNMHSIQMLRDSPEMMGTSLDMLRRAAMVLLHLSKVPANRKMFVHQQSRLLSLVMSQFLDQHVAQILSDVLFQCSQLS